MPESNLFDNILESLTRAVHRNAAITLSNASKAEIFRLNDDELLDFLNDKLSQLPAAEIDNLFAPIISVLSVFFPRKSEVTPSPPEAPLITLPENHQSAAAWSDDIFLLGFLGCAALTIISQIIFEICQFMSQPRMQVRGLDRPITQQESLKLSKRSPSLLPPKPIYARRAIVFPKGLKVFGEPYIRKTNIVFRQVYSTEEWLSGHAPYVV
ncbi:hypothetical protein TSUD_237350 [Trifolium subterraneum]|uniref:Uncharacterized protein n=1 Tax=Trifolium subterraneum TaxID=3900 RepID=A0A2Z6PGQ2_TRISU|nr:hypothetical protein TSUD_237350 [Trifolium subterraneum]